MHTFNQSVSERIIIELAYYRYDEEKYPNLNINLLFEIFNDLTFEQFDSLVYPFYQTAFNNSIDKLLKQLDGFLGDFHETYHNFLNIFYILSHYHIRLRIYIEFTTLIMKINSNLLIY